ncbi:MAG: AEC family transporter [Oscillospiraceae bacterium]|nr:AEC family transporter [Oscillospiraceae bacterium]
MLDSLRFVGTQVLVLFIILAAGFCCRKLRLLAEEAVKGLTNLMLYLITPCMMLKAFQQPYDPGLLRGFLISAGAAAGFYGLEIGLAKLLLRDKNDARRRVEHFGAVFPNCGYMALPLLQSLWGSEAVLYGAAFNAAHTVFLWTYGLSLMSSGKEKISLRKALVNPGTVSVVLGLVLFFGSVKLPALLATPIDYLAALNAPVPMLIIGFYLAALDPKAVLRSGGEFLMLALRLLIVPALAMGALWLCGVRGVLLITNVVCLAAPVATMCTMFATKYDVDPTLSAGMVAASTVLSILTMTLVVGFATYIS